MRYILSAVVTLVIFIIYAICYLALDLPYGLRSVWPAFVFIFAFSLYLTSKPLMEEDDVA